MSEILNELFELTMRGLTGDIYDEPISDETHMYQLIHEHGLAAMCFEAIDQDLVSPEFYNKLKKTTDAFILRDAQQTELFKALIGIFIVAEVPHIFLKGMFLKSLYPKRYMRGMGDIDILIKTEDLEYVHHHFLSHDMKCVSKSYEHYVYITKEGLTIELHPRLLSHDKRVILEDPFKAKYLARGYTYVLPYTEELIYLFSHLKKHVLHSGIGFTSLIDIGYYVMRFERSIDVKRFHLLLDEYQLTEFYRKIMMLNHIYFYFNYIEPWFDYDALEEDKFAQLSDYLARSGTHGLGKDFFLNEVKVARYQLEAKGKIQMFFDMVFPPYHDIKWMYPKLLFIPLFLPIAWGLRLLSYVFDKDKKVMIKLKSFKADKVEVNEVLEVFDYLGVCDKI